MNTTTERWYVVFLGSPGNRGTGVHFNWHPTRLAAELYRQEFMLDDWVIVTETEMRSMLA